MHAGTRFVHTFLSWSAMRILRKQLALVAIGLLAAVAAISTGCALLHEPIEWFGLGLIFICVAGRTWCSLYIGGQKNKTLTFIGPYSVCRNPLYVFSCIGAVGMGAQFGSVTLAVAAGLICFLIQHMLVRQEERALLRQFGAAYSHYCARVPRYIPRLALWTAPSTLEVQMPFVIRTFFDACIFLAAIPATEALEALQASGVLPVFFHLP